MQVNNLAKYVASILNIKSDNPFIMNDIFEELEQISDLKAFKDYLKSQSHSNEYQYSKGLSKFLKIVSNYKKKQKDLIVLQNPSINSFSEALYKKTVLVFEEVNWHLQNGKRIEDFNMLKSFDEKELRVLNKIGDKSYILTKVKSNKPSLEEEIKNIVMSYTIQKHTISPALPFKDKEVIKKISKN